jgi:hypothetical protein
LQWIKDVIHCKTRPSVLIPIDPPAEEFRHLTEPQVEAALRFTADPAKNPIVGEVLRLMRVYGDAMIECVARYGHVPDDFALAPRYPIEFIAAVLFRQTMRIPD